MANEPTTVEKLRGLRWSFATNASNTVFSQFIYFGSAFVLFLNELGLSKTEIGLILSLIPLTACMAPFIAPLTARVGYKRTFVIFYLARKLITFLLLLTPWVLTEFGDQVIFFYVTGVVALFSTIRSIEETAYYPWVQEFVPNTVRGKYSATSNILSGITGFVAVGIAGLVLDRTVGLDGFMLLFAVGTLFGLFSVWASTFIPGGAPDPQAAAGRRDLWAALGDADFRRYLIGLALITLGTVPLASFLPLFMQEQVGLSAGSVVLLQMGTLLGTLVSGYLWGWAADRYGSKPIMLTGLIMLVLIPLLWWTIPKGVALSLPLALIIAFLQGTANLGWGIGAGRLLFVSIVPTAKKRDYMALYFAWAGITAAFSQFVGGRALDFSQGISGSFLFLELDPYTPLFLAAVLLPLVSVGLLHAIRGDSPFSTAQFAGFFLRGNPVLALGSLIRFYRARNEHDTVLITERMGEIRSPLAVDELLDALTDPRFNVRYEAILSIARMPADPRLTRALIKVLQEDLPAMSVVAAWALGKIGEDQHEAREALQTALSSKYRSVQAHSVRALGSLGDSSIVPTLLARLTAERDEGLRVACASTLGKLGAREAIHPMLSLLRASQDETMRMELALALARIVGEERAFIRLHRHMRSQPSIAAAQAIGQIRRILPVHLLEDNALHQDLHDCADSFASDNMDEGAMILGKVLQAIPTHWFGEATAPIIIECIEQLVCCGAARLEYLLLTLHLLTLRVPGPPMLTFGLDANPVRGIQLQSSD
ncbi:MAG: MFS transporter [Caldilineaceae bacterium]|nr:MFS transporter [Caldilineaceae bacterium]